MLRLESLEEEFSKIDPAQLKFIVFGLKNHNVMSLESSSSDFDMTNLIGC